MIIVTFGALGAVFASTGKEGDHVGATNTWERTQGLAKWLTCWRFAGIISALYVMEPSSRAWRGESHVRRGDFFALSEADFVLQIPELHLHRLADLVHHRYPDRLVRRYHQRTGILMWVTGTAIMYAYIDFPSAICQRIVQPVLPLP